MKSPVKMMLSIVAVSVSVAPSAHAEMTYYLGGGIAYSSADSLPRVGGDPTRASSGNLVGLGLTGGMRLDTPSLFYGAEVDADINIGGELNSNRNGLSCADRFADNPYYCSQGATVRARAIFGTSIQEYEVFGTVGYAVMSGQAAVQNDGRSEPFTVGGITYGIGAQRAFGAGKLRAEII